MEAARARVVKLRGILATLGEDDDMFPSGQFPNASSRQSCLSRGSRSGWTQPKRPLCEPEREAQAAAVADQEQHEVLLKAIPFLFKVDPQHEVPDVAEFKRMQDTIVRLQRELSSLLSVDPVDPTVDDGESLVADLPHKKSRVGPTTPLGTSTGVPRTPLAITGGHAQGSSGLHPM